MDPGDWYVKRVEHDTGITGETSESPRHVHSVPTTFLLAIPVVDSAVLHSAIDSQSAAHTAYFLTTAILPRA